MPPIRLTYLVITSSELLKWGGGQVLKTRSQKLGVCEAEREGFQMRLQKTLIRFSPNEVRSNNDLIVPKQIRWAEAGRFYLSR